MENTKSLFLYCADNMTVESNNYRIRLADIGDIYTIGVVFIW